MGRTDPLGRTRLVAYAFEPAGTAPARALGPRFPVVLVQSSPGPWPGDQLGTTR